MKESADITEYWYDQWARNTLSDTRDTMIWFTDRLGTSAVRDLSVSLGPIGYWRNDPRRFQHRRFSTETISNAWRLIIHLLAEPFLRVRPVEKAELSLCYRDISTEGWQRLYGFYKEQIGPAAASLITDEQYCREQRKARDETWKFIEDIQGTEAIAELIRDWQAQMIRHGPAFKPNDLLHHLTKCLRVCDEEDYPQLWLKTHENVQTLGRWTAESGELRMMRNFIEEFEAKVLDDQQHLAKVRLRLQQARELLDCCDREYGEEMPCYITSEDRNRIAREYNLSSGHLVVRR